MAYLLFGGTAFYATGGMNDCLGIFDTIEDARSYAITDREDEYENVVHNEWYQIVDSTNFQVVEHKGYVFGNKGKFCCESELWVVNHLSVFWYLSYS